MTNWKYIYKQAKDWALDAGEQIKQLMQSHIEVSSKAQPTDLVTNADKAIEQFFIANIKQHYPTHRIVGEESTNDDIMTTEGIIWFIDPIDGTTNFIHQKRCFAISIGIYEEGIGKVGIIYDVMANELYHAFAGHGAFCNGRALPQLKQVAIEKSLIAMNIKCLIKKPAPMKALVDRVRGALSLGSAAIQLAYVASGQLDAYINMKKSSWDIAAGKVLIEEVGGEVSTFSGEKINLLGKSSVFAASPGYYQQVCALTTCTKVK